MSEKSKAFYYILIDGDDSVKETGYFDNLAKAQAAWADWADDGDSIAVVCSCAEKGVKWVKA